MKKIVYLLFFLFLFPSLASGAHIPQQTLVYLYGGTTNTYIKQLNITKDKVEIVSPNFFVLNKDGQLTIDVNESLVKYIRETGKKIIPFISNHWNRQSGILALKNQDQIVAQLVKSIVSYDLDGLNYDIENLTESERDLQTQFIKKLADKLQPLGKTVTVAIPPVSGNQSTGWFASFDYEAIGKIADYIYVMTYDQHYEGSPPGPVAGIPWIKESLDYLTKIIPPEKIILGLPFYGRTWSSGSKGKGINYSQIENLISTYGGKPGWDGENQVPYVKLYDKRGNFLYEIWYENERSLTQKLQLVNQYQLAGWGAWRLGQEDPAFWFKVDRYQNNPFRDISTYWGRDAILSLNRLHLINGYQDGTFRPNQTITREEMAQLLKRVMKLPDKKGFPFSDVPMERWSSSSIGTISLYGLMKGYPDGTFKPAHPVTRAELAAILSRSFSFNTSEEKRMFPDIVGHWAEKAISTLQMSGVINGYENGLFKPDQPVTRGEVSAILNRILN
ncbi:S-layer homology domain-containing protein [Microaerobacter geothermalis]|uniref:S-layer homology domain-containing protein n=1 Tax=Microaerobacter geothermalis TaxID=674972 RepID=UPI001F2B23DD|nr:S-layer homology domain-containing protein [Microaerobacter geothermalis]MCF6093725.1 S-layer homology domain-containing protein [Microaerobacter geothermalis]